MTVTHVVRVLGPCEVNQPAIDSRDTVPGEGIQVVKFAGQLFFSAAIRRAYDPGCRVDQMPVIEGPRGCGKSQALRLLAIEDAWFSDDLPLDGSARQLIEATAGKWIIEVALDQLLDREADAAIDRESAPRRRPSMSLKTFLSRTHDEARMAYRTTVSCVPRGYIVVGTSCGDCRIDLTGSRRISPANVQRFDLAQLREVRDQLWAEARAVHQVKTAFA